jgi:hypothetical protein
VTARFGTREKPPVDLLKRWIDESYRAVAPKKLVARLSAGSAPAADGSAKTGAPPSEKRLRERLSPAHVAWTKLLDSRPSLVREWKLYSRKAGFTLRLKDGERTLLYLQPQDGDFRAVVILGEKAVKAALGGRLPSRLRDAIEGARPYVEGRSVSLTVRTPADLRDVRTLLSSK